MKKYRQETTHFFITNIGRQKVMEIIGSVMRDYTSSFLCRKSQIAKNHYSLKYNYDRRMSNINQPWHEIKERIEIVEKNRNFYKERKQWTER